MPLLGITLPCPGKPHRNPDGLPWLSWTSCPGETTASQRMSIWSWQDFCRPCSSLAQEPGPLATAAKPRVLPVLSRCREEQRERGPGGVWLETDNGNGHLRGFEWLVNRNKNRLVFHLSSQGWGTHAPLRALLGFIPRRTRAHPPTCRWAKNRKGHRDSYMQKAWPRVSLLSRLSQTHNPRPTHQRDHEEGGLPPRLQGNPSSKTVAGGLWSHSRDILFHTDQQTHGIMQRCLPKSQNIWAQKVTRQQLPNKVRGNVTVQIKTSGWCQLSVMGCSFLQGEQITKVKQAGAHTYLHTPFPQTTRWQSIKHSKTQTLYFHSHPPALSFRSQLAPGPQRAEVCMSSRMIERKWRTQLGIGWPQDRQRCPGRPVFPQALGEAQASGKRPHGGASSWVFSLARRVVTPRPLQTKCGKSPGAAPPRGVLWPKTQAHGTTERGGGGQGWGCVRKGLPALPSPVGLPYSLPSLPVHCVSCS